MNSQAKQELNKLCSEDGSAEFLARSVLLKGFTPSQKLAILHCLGTRVTEEAIRSVSQSKWLCYRGCGKGFLAKLAERGLLENLSDLCVRSKQPLTDEERYLASKATRLEKLRLMIWRAQSQIEKWEREVAALKS